MYEVIVIGGSYAGLAATLQLVRGRRRVLVIDAGVRRNRNAAHSHGFLGQDGRDPAEIAAKARAEVLAYPTAQLLEAEVESAQGKQDHFTVRVKNGDSYEAERLVLALGVVDEFPAIPGVEERWGRSIFHCPYCHGYELDRGHIGVLATGPLSIHQGIMLPDWGETTYFTRGFEPTAEELAALGRRGARVERAEVVGIEQHATVRLADQRTLSFAGLFLAPRNHIPGQLVSELGLELEEGPFGSIIKTDPMMKSTSVPGVFACGDAALPAGSVTFAVGDGARAGFGAHRSLMFR
ncbi:MAG: NAD(P)/FAD-dependent oxidoreductase [Polyangiaceae bacterium]